MAYSLRLHAPNAEGLILGQVIKSHMLQLRPNAGKQTFKKKKKE